MIAHIAITTFFWGVLALSVYSIILTLAKGFNNMTNVNIGLIAIAIFLAIFAAAFIFGPSVMAGHEVLAVLLFCMFGMGLGVAIIEGK